MKTIERIKPLPEHGEIGHFCKGGCAGYAKGGVVSQDALDLADLAGSGPAIAADPEMMQAGLDAAAKDKADALDLSDIAASGAPIAADPEMLEAALRAQREGTPGYAEGGQVEAAETADAKDPSELPDDIREFVEKMHKEKRESRPDEGWRIAAMEKKEDLAPYKKNEDEAAADPDIMEQLKGLTGYAEGGEIPDPTAGLGLLEPPGAGLIAPSIMQRPAAPPAAPMPAAAAPAPVATPKPAMPPAPALTDADYMTRANKMLGLQPEEQAGFMKLLGGNAQKAQLGAGIAGIGDAIAAGGTLGKVNPGGLNKSEELIDHRTQEGLQGMQTIRENQGKAFEMADKLESRDPKSPLSKWAQKAYGSIGKKLGLDLNNASAALIGDVTGKGVDALNVEYQNQLKMMGLDLQKQQVAATIANQKAERDIAREGHQLEAAKAGVERGPLDKAFGLIPGTTSNKSNKVLESVMTGDKGPVAVNTRAEYDALASGTHYVDSHGTQKVKK